MTTSSHEWREAGRKSLGIAFFPASGAGHFSYAELVYEVAERRGTEWRTLIERSAPFYLHEHPEVAEVFPIACIAVGAIRRAIEKTEGTNP